MNLLPKDLDFIPMPSPQVRKMAYQEKVGEITASRKRGIELAEKYGKKALKPSSQEVRWLFYDTLITTTKTEDFDPYFELYREKLVLSYPWEICHWLKNWYSIWKFLRLHMHFPLPPDDAILFFTLAYPFPPGITCPDYEGQPVSFHKVMGYLHTLYTKTLSRQAVEEVLNDRELLETLLDGKIIPYKYTEVLPYGALYSKVTNYIIMHPKLCASLAPHHQRAIENLRALGGKQALFKAPWFLEIARIQKDGATEEELYDLLLENIPKESE